jgi:ethanolamine utilization protein EutQ (cupin superfamily)
MIRAPGAREDRAMPKYLSQEWLDEGTKLAEGQPDRPGASARMQYVVTGGPDGDIKYYWLLENGKLLEAKIGEISDADFTLTLTYDDSVKVQKGELDANAAFMQGRMKVTGNMGKLMQLMPLTNSPEYKELQEQVRKITEY